MMSRTRSRMVRSIVSRSNCSTALPSTLPLLFSPMGVLLRHPPPSGRSCLGLNSRRMTPFSIFHQTHDTTAGEYRHSLQSECLPRVHPKDPHLLVIGDLGQ